MTTLAELVPPEFWPTIDRLDQLIRASGVPLPQLGPALRSVALLDPDKLRAAATVWGASGANGLPDEFARGMATDLATVTAKVGERWDGPAWTQFSTEMASAQQLIGRLGAPARQVGTLLDEYADKMAKTWDEIVGWVVTIAGAVVTAVTWETGIGAVVGLIITAIGVALQAYQWIVPELTTVQNTVEQLTGEIHDKVPGVDDTPIKPPKTGDWHQRTADPNN
jgi:uncharacterized protein YukE